MLVAIFEYDLLMIDTALFSCFNKDWQSGRIKLQKAGGQTNSNWFLTYKGQKFFVRLPWQAGVAGIVDRKAEAGNIAALYRNKKLAGILPKCYFYIFKKRNIVAPKSAKRFDLPDGAAVFECLEGRDINGADLTKPKIQEALLKTLFAFHSSGVKFVNEYDVFRDEITKYKNKAKKYPIDKLIGRAEIQKIEAIEKEVKKQLPLAGAVATHNDLIFENLRLGKNGKVYLLDFEYAGYNLRSGLYYDLGILLGGNLFQKKPITLPVFEQIMKKAEKIYGQPLGMEKIYAGAITNILVMFWWGLVKYFSSESPRDRNYFASYVKKRAKMVSWLYRNLLIS